MTRLALLWRTTTVRLTALFLVIFGLFAVLLLAYISYQSSIQLQNQQRADIDREVALIQRMDRRQGLRAVILAVDRLASQPGRGSISLPTRTASSTRTASCSRMAIRMVPAVDRQVR